MATRHDPEPTPEELAQERWILALLAEIRHEIRAPRRVRVQIEASVRRDARVAGLRGAVSAAVAAGLVAVALLLPGGTLGAPSVSEAAALASRGAVAPAPAPDPEDPDAKLSQPVDDVYFPNWSVTRGWRATGQRGDRLEGHRAVTVYYASGARRLAYTIVSAPALAQPSARVTVQDGITLRMLAIRGRLVVTWRRDGRTCVLTGTRVSAAQLRRLAAVDPPPDHQAG